MWRKGLRLPMDDEWPRTATEDTNFVRHRCLGPDGPG